MMIVLPSTARLETKSARCSQAGRRGICSIGFDNSMHDCVANQFCRRAQVELVLYILAMSLRGFGADAEGLCDILAGGPISEQAQHLALAQSELAFAPAAGRTGIFELAQQDRGNR